VCDGRRKASLELLMKIISKVIRALADILSYDLKRDPGYQRLEEMEDFSKKGRDIRGKLQDVKRAVDSKVTLYTSEASRTKNPNDIKIKNLFEKVQKESIKMIEEGIMKKDPSLIEKGLISAKALWADASNIIGK